MSLFPCRWEWCRKTFPVSSERTYHVIQDHIAIATPVKWREHLRLVNLEEEELSGTINSLPTLPSTEPSQHHSPSNTSLPEPPESSTGPRAAVTRQHTPPTGTAAFSTLSAHSSPDPIIASQPASPSIDVLLAQSSGSLSPFKRMSGQSPSKRLSRQSTTSSRDVEDQLTQNIPRSPSKSPGPSSRPRNRQFPPPDTQSSSSQSSQPQGPRFRSGSLRVHPDPPASQAQDRAQISPQRQNFPTIAYPDSPATIQSNSDGSQSQSFLLQTQAPYHYFDSQPSV